jgi:DNA-binding NarL/FixJ family response regulator
MVNISELVDRSGRSLIPSDLFQACLQSVEDPVSLQGGEVLQRPGDKTAKDVELSSSAELLGSRSMKAPYSLLIIDDQEVILNGLAAMLRRFHERVVIVGTASGAEEALTWLGDHECDLILSDVRLKGDSGIDLCAEILHRRADQAFAFFTVYDDEHYLFQALRVGARGFLLKQTTGEALVAHLEQVLRGEIVIDPALAGRIALLAARLQSGEFWPGAHLGLTQRESEVLELVVQGLSNRAVAHRLILGEETVKTHLSSIYRKLDVRDRSQAVAAALREGVFH